MPKSRRRSLATPVEGAQAGRMTACLVLKDRGWILEKMAVRLAEHLLRWNVQAEIAAFPSQSADVNHWMLYTDMGGTPHGINTLLITHVDRAAKLYILKRRLVKSQLGICLSRMTREQLVLAGIPRERLCFITPAHDGILAPRRIVIGITTQLRNDGAKREDLLLDMARTMTLESFHFEIIGPRWEKVLPVLRAAGATVRYTSGAYQRDNQEHLKLVHEGLQMFDYYLYFGFDEGSMGFLDALAAGVPTITTPQGFHIDINGGITHAFTSSAELSAIFRQLSDERQKRIDSVAGLTWNEYARQHALVWRALKENRPQDLEQLLHGGQTFSTPLPDLRRPIGPPYPKGRSLRRKASSAMEDLSFLWEFYTGRKINWTRLIRFMRRFTWLLGE